MKKLTVVVILAILAMGAFIWNTNRTIQDRTTATGVKLSRGFNKHLYPTDESLSPWVVVNKQHPLYSKQFTPNDLVLPNVPQRVLGHESMQTRRTAATALETMFAAAKGEGINLMLASAYRSYDYQVGLYNGYVQSQGQATADTQSARPGYSEHQTGLAVDIEPESHKCEVEQCFADTPEGKWLAANSYKYGFILRYTADKVDITGYEYEPWHFRYVGTELSMEMHKTGVSTLEEFFGITGGKNY